MASESLQGEILELVARTNLLARAHVEGKPLTREIARVIGQANRLNKLFGGVQSGDPTKSRARIEAAKQFQALWGDPQRPRRLGTDSRATAERAFVARVAEGNDIAELVAGAHRYFAFLAATGRAGTEFQMQLCRFFGPGRHWESAYVQRPTEVDELSGARERAAKRFAA